MGFDQNERFESHMIFFIQGLLYFPDLLNLHMSEESIYSYDQLLTDLFAYIQMLSQSNDSYSKKHMNFRVFFLFLKRTYKDYLMTILQVRHYLYEISLVLNQNHNY
jgi:hypothetical protein